MQCKDVEFVVEQEGVAPLAEAARAHVATCSDCQEFVADLASIVFLANELPAEVDPPARLWNSLRAQLEVEGIIKAPVVPAGGERSSWWHGFGGFFLSRAMATTAVGLLIVVAGVLHLRQAPDTSLRPDARPASQIAFPHTAKVLHYPEVALTNR